MKILFFLGTIDFLLSVVSYIYYRQNFVFARSWVFLLVYLLLSFNTFLPHLLPASAPLLLMKTCLWLRGLWIAFLYYSVLLAVLHGLLFLSGKLFGWHLPHHKRASAGLSFVLLFIAWGTFRAFSPTLRTEEIVTHKLPADTQYKIVLVSDIHLGAMLGKNYATDLVEKINAHKPDLVLFAGDMLDEKIHFVEKEDSLAPLANINAPLGVYAAYGNHDYLDKPQLWQKMLEAANIKVLRDSDSIINNQLKITGLNDFSRNRSNASLEKLSADNAAYYNILIDHQPRKMEAAADVGYDLYVAGHTHTGQLFPNRLVTQKMYKLDYGRTNFGKLTAITSNGYGFWGPPVRTEVKPEMVIINLKGR